MDMSVAASVRVGAAVASVVGVRLVIIRVAGGLCVVRSWSAGGKAVTRV